MNERPTISVVMPVYNGDPYIDAAVSSILSQTMSDFEYVIVDDCSSDSTPAKLAEFAQKDGRIRVIRNDQNLGSTKSSNIALNNARGEFIARMDADDISLPSRLEKQLQVMRTRPEVVLCGTSTVRIDGQGKPIAIAEWPADSRVLSWYGVFRPIVAHPTAMYRRSAIEQGLRYDEKLRTAQDYGLWSEMMKYGRAKTVASPQLLYRQHVRSISSVEKGRQHLDAAGICKKNLIRTFPDFFAATSAQSVAGFIYGTSVLDPEGAAQALATLSSLERYYVESIGVVDRGVSNEIQRLTLRWMTQAVLQQRTLSRFQKLKLFFALRNRAGRLIEEGTMFVSRRTRARRFR